MYYTLYCKGKEKEFSGFFVLVYYIYTTHIYTNICILFEKILVHEIIWKCCAKC